MDNLKSRCSGKGVVVKLFVHDNCHRQVFANQILLNYTTAQITHWIAVVRAVARTLIGGGGCLFIYSCSARLVCFQIDKFEFDFKRN